MIDSIMERVSGCNAGVGEKEGFVERGRKEEAGGHGWCRRVFKRRARG